MFMLTESSPNVSGVMSCDDLVQCTSDATQCVNNIHVCDWHAAECRGEHDASGTDYDQAKYAPPSPPVLRGEYVDDR